MINTRRGLYHGHFLTFRYSNGDVFSGQWKSGLKHGAETYAMLRTVVAWLALGRMVI